MWDEGAGPLWGDGGLLGMGAEWMRRALGLSDSLIDELLTWMHDMAERLRAEVGVRYRVRYHA